GGDVDDATESDPTVGGGAHGAVLTRGVDGGASSLLGGQSGGRPAGEFELGMPGAVAARDPVAILGAYDTLGVDQYPAERFIARVARIRGQLATSAQVGTFPLSDHADHPARTRTVRQWRRAPVGSAHVRRAATR